MLQNPYNCRQRAGLYLLASLVMSLCLLPPRPALAQSGAEQVVRAHFDAILAEDYKLADTYFSREFRSAFKGDIARMQAYYRTRMDQLKRGYEIIDAVTLDDGDRETMRLTVDFGDPRPDDDIEITERIFYYMIRQNSTDGDASAGKAWRIDIFDALSYESLADARRRPYLYTGEEWDEFASRELIARQGLFRIQMALESFHHDNQNYPFRLLGDYSRRDELISANKLGPKYPQCGFADRPMRSVQFEEKSSGDFSYYGYDTDGDGSNEGYWLLLHGRDESGFYFEGRDTIYILSNAVGMSQLDQALGFAQYWQSRAGTAPVLTDVTEFLLPEYITGGPLSASPATPSMDELASQIQRGDSISGNLERAGNMFEEEVANTTEGEQSESPEQAAGSAVLPPARLARLVGNWIAASALGRLQFLLGPLPPPDPMAAIKVTEELKVYSFGLWD